MESLTLPCLVCGLMASLAINALVVMNVLTAKVRDRIVWGAVGLGALAGVPLIWLILSAPGVERSSDVPLAIAFMFCTCFVMGARSVKITRTEK